MLADFLRIAQDSQQAGGRVLLEWTSDPQKFLKKNVTPLDATLRGLPPENAAEVQQIVDYFIRMAFYFLFKKLEEGEGRYEFELNMKDEKTGETVKLISPERDLDIRTSFL
jgi:hypothetical protein